MAYGRPSDASPEDWYEAAKNIDQNRAANKAFKSAYRAPVLAPRPMTNPMRPTSFNSFQIPPPTKPVPMDIDTSRKKAVVVPVVTNVESQVIRCQTVHSDLISEAGPQRN